MKRFGFTFVELVFSIVIVGLVILSIPLIVRQSNENTLEAQNVIGYYNALTLMDTIRNKPWDENNVTDFTQGGAYYILNTSDTANNCQLASALFPAKYGSIGTDADFLTKKGLGGGVKRRMCDPNGKTASAISGSTTRDSIGAFDGYSHVITSTSDGETTANNFFKLAVSVRYVSVNFGSDTATGTISTANGTTDVKEITIYLCRIQPGEDTNKTCDSNEGTNNLTLVSSYRYYAANIGTDIPLSKDNI